MTYTPAELAAEWKVSDDTILALIRSGKLRAYRVGRQWRIDGAAVGEYKACQENASSAGGREARGTSPGTRPAAGGRPLSDDEARRLLSETLRRRGAERR